MTRRLTSLISEWTEEHLDTYCLDTVERERVRWECSFGLSREQGPQIAITFFLPGAVLGTWQQTMALLTNPVAVTSEDIDGLVKQSLEELRKARSEQLANQGT